MFVAKVSNLAELVVFTALLFGGANHCHKSGFAFFMADNMFVSGHKVADPTTR